MQVLCLRFPNTWQYASAVGTFSKYLAERHVPLHVLGLTVARTMSEVAERLHVNKSFQTLMGGEGVIHYLIRYPEFGSCR